MCCDAPSPPPPPDLRPVAAASDRAAELGYQAAQDDLAFRRQVYAEERPRIQQLQDLASRVANQQMGIADANESRARDQWNYWQRSFQPTEQAMNLDAFQAQYLSPEELADLQANPARAVQYARLAADRQAQEQSQGYMRAAGENVADIDQLESRGLRSLDTQRDQQLEFLRGRELQDREMVDAQIASAYGAANRGLARYGAGSPNRMAAMATRVGNDQALARVAGLNALSQGYAALGQQVRDVHGSQRLGLEQGMGQQRLGVRAGARENARSTQANRYALGTSLRAGSAAFGRNMPNTAGQAYGLATQAGSSAVANSNTGANAGLPHAQFMAGGFGTQLGAAGIGANTALGMGGLQNQTYGSQVSAYNAAQQARGQGLAGLGQFAGMAMAAQNPWWLATAGARRG